jgi:hypothetical protein
MTTQPATMNKAQIYDLIIPTIVRNPQIAFNIHKRLGAERIIWREIDDDRAQEVYAAFLAETRQPAAEMVAALAE